MNSPGDDPLHPCKLTFIDDPTGFVTGSGHAHLHERVGPRELQLQGGCERHELL